jgi:DNA modification methylase
VIARYLFKLRSNIVMENDLMLARMELEAFVGALHDLPDIEIVQSEFRELGELKGLTAIISHLRRKGQQAYTADAPLSLLPEILRCVSFVQQIYCVTDNTPAAHQLVSDSEARLGKIIRTYPHGDKLIVYAVPHYALFELSEVVVRRSKHIADTRRNLAVLLDALLGRTDDLRACQPKGLTTLADDALSAQSTTSHLSHDVHYYKAKFFPRMARAMLNLCAQRLGGGNHRVLDNFVGSGTTLLEASLLGLPSVGLDLDPLSVLIAETKVGVLHLDSAHVADEAERAIGRLQSRNNGQLSLFDALPPHGDEPITFPAWLLKNRRMTPQIAAGLSEEINVVRAVVAESDPVVRDLFRVLLSDAIAHRIRMRFLGTGVGRFALTFSRMTLPQLFVRSLARYVKVVAACQWLRETLHLDLAEARVIAADARCIPDEVGPFDILLTSPPYLPASSGRESYAKARAPSLIALGMVANVDDLVDESIGSIGEQSSPWELLRNSTDAGGSGFSELSDEAYALVDWLRQDELRAIKAEPTARYFLDMRRAFAEANRVLRPGGLAVVVSGRDSTFYSFADRQVLRVVHAAEMLADEAHRAGFEVEALHDLPLKKANANARPRSLDDYYETLILLRKP